MRSRKAFRIKSSSEYSILDATRFSVQKSKRGNTGRTFPNDLYRAMYRILLCASLFICTACASHSRISPTQQLDIHSFKKEFQYFLKVSKNQDEATVWRNWQTAVQAKDPIFFQQVVAEAADTPNWEEKIRASLKKAWPILQKYELEIEAEFEHFPQLLQENLTIFQKTFPDFDLSQTPVFAVPSLLKFNGKGTEAYGPKALAFGIDTIVYFRKEPRFFPRVNAKSNAKVLYSHEMFHIYHGQKQGLASDFALSNGTLLNDAWNEGLATYVSGLINPAASDADLLMDANLAESCKESGETLLQNFKKIAFEKSNSPKGKELYRNWFTLASKDQSLPLRAGYCVGLLIARRMTETGITAIEMATWPYAEVPSRLEKILN